MKYTTAMVLASASAATASTNCAEDAGNWYCSPVSLIKYTGLEGSGSYKAVSAMDSTTGDCSFESTAYSGSIAPFNEELSVHIRGPTQLKQFAVYTPGTASSKKRQEHKSHHKRHGHQHLHHKKHEETKQEAARAVGDLVTATIDGQVVTWTNTWSGVADPVADVAVAAAETSTASAASAATTYAQSAKTKTTSATSSAATVASGDYARIAYYNAEDGTADGVTFLGAHGGSGSGVFDYKFGSSLSYLSADGTAGAESSTVLDNVLVGDSTEYAIFSDVECTSGDANCGYYRDGSVAYQGFGGADKIFMFEFTMPSTGTSCSDCDMPAIWLLNAKIPRTQQYGDCSCWPTTSSSGGCGEADLFEVLNSGSTKAKSTFHFANSLGSSDYFTRPTSDYIKIAAYFQESSSTATIRVLDSSVDFSSSLSADVVNTSIVDEVEGLLATVMDLLTGA